MMVEEVKTHLTKAYLLLKDESLLAEARHGYEFMQKYCVDQEKGGVY